MTGLDAFAGAPVKMRDVRFPRLRDAWRDFLDLLCGRFDDDWRRQTQANRWALYACRAAADFEAAGDDRSAADCRKMAMGEKR